MTVQQTKTHLPWRGFQQLDEPLLSFSPSDPSQATINPLIGLTKYGPYSQAAFDGYQKSIRIAVVCEQKDYTFLKRILNEAGKEHQPRERKEYVPPFPGFQAAFGLPLERAEVEAWLPNDLEERLKNSNTPHQDLAKAITDRIGVLHQQRYEFDVVVFYIPQRYSQYFEVRHENFDLHDYVKAYAAKLNVTTQILTDDALSYRCRASVAWRLSTALYAKAGGTPWKLDTSSGHLDSDTAYIGISYALKNSPNGGTTFVTCCSQVFDADGGGMEFIAYDVSSEKDFRNPHLSREEMRIVMSRSLELYQRRHRGQSPARLVVHKQTPFLENEVQGCFDAWNGAGTDVTCVQVTKTPWRAVLLGKPKQAGTTSTPLYATGRGTTVQLDGQSILLWVGGNAPTATLSGGGNYFQGGKGTPRPLLLTRSTGTGPLTELAAQVLALSKMDWNNDALYDSLPCTIQYAKTLARAMKNCGNLESKPYDYRLFM